MLHFAMYRIKLSAEMQSSVVDPNTRTLNLDPDFGLIWIRTILEKKFKNNFKEKQFSLKKYIF